MWNIDAGFLTINMLQDGRATHTPKDIPVVVLVGQVDTANNDSPMILITKMTLIRKRGVCVTVSSSN